MSFTKVTVGDELPALEIPVTPTLIVAAAIASRDYQDVHHDSERARTQGMPDIFMNILTTNGLVGRLVTDWAGPDCQLRKISIRLGVPCFPGDTLRLTGSVVSAEPTGDGGLVEVAVRGTNASGDHVTGSVHVALPGEGSHERACERIDKHSASANAADEHRRGGLMSELASESVSTVPPRMRPTSVSEEGS